MNIIKKLSFLLDRQQKRGLVLIFFLMFVGMVFESLGVALILPLLAMWALNVEDIPRRTDGTFNPFDEENGARFDPAYIWAPNQGVRGNFGVRFNLKK